MPRGPQQGDRYGDWYLESRAKPIDGKRHWNVVNTETDETRVVAQTELKNLEADAPSSAEITARVLIGNHKDDPFNLPEGVLPDDEDEYPFAVEFVEPENVFESDADYDEDITDLDCTPTEGCPADNDCVITEGKHVIDGYTEEESAAIFEKFVAPAENPWDPGPNVGWLRVAELCKQLSDAICDAIEAK